jgi:hypothetical protein
MIDQRRSLDRLAAATELLALPAAQRKWWRPAVRKTP